MTATNGQTGTGESTGTAQTAPPPFHVPAGSACVDDCDDAPLGWSTPAVGAANLPAQAQGGEGDMIGCWQVAQTADPHGDSAVSGQEEIMQLYVSADGAGGNSGGAEYDTAEQRGERTTRSRTLSRPVAIRTRSPATPRLPAATRTVSPAAPARAAAAKPITTYRPMRRCWSVSRREFDVSFLLGCGRTVYKNATCSGKRNTLRWGASPAAGLCFCKTKLGYICSLTPHKGFAVSNMPPHMESWRGCGPPGTSWWAQQTPGRAERGPGAIHSTDTPGPSRPFRRTLPGRA